MVATSSAQVKHEGGRSKTSQARTAFTVGTGRVGDGPRARVRICWRSSWGRVRNVVDVLFLGRRVAGEMASLALMVRVRVESDFVSEAIAFAYAGGHLMGLVRVSTL